jgi:hypothetical protein
MAKDSAKEKQSDSPQQRFERLLRKLVAVPKAEADKQQKKWARNQQKKRSC